MTTTGSGTPGTRVAAVQGTPVLYDREATIEHVGRLTKEAAGQGAALVAFPEAFVARLPGLGVAHDTVGRRRVVRPLGGSGRRRARSRLRRPRRDRGGERGLPRGARQRARRRDDLQHAPLLRPRRRVPRQAPQAHADGRRAARVGPGRRLDADHRRHAVRPRRRTHLLGELHAARAARRCTSKASTSCSRRRGTTPTCGSRRCATSPRKAAATCSASRRACAPPTCPLPSPGATTSTAGTTTGCRAGTP